MSEQSAEKKENSRGSNSSSQTKLNIVLPILFSLVAIMGMIVGMKLQKTSPLKQPLNFGEQQRYTSINDIISFIESEYVDTIDKSDLYEEAVTGIMKELDPHSNFIPSSELESVNENLDGEFEGIGIEFSLVEDTITVVSPISGGPSELLGIRSGDKIVKINDTIVAGIGFTSKDVVSRLRGRRGTKVKVGIKRGGISDIISYNIKRNKIPIYSIDTHYLIDDETGYIKINRFSRTTYEEFMEALVALKEEGARDFILDVRQNPGGFLDAATQIADEMIAGKKLLVYTEGRSTGKREYVATRKGQMESGKVAILIDSGSASASEILAGAIQDWDRGSIIGRRTYGKALVQQQFDLRDGSALRLTIAKYFTPSGRCIQKSYNDGRDAYFEEVYDRVEGGEFTSEDSIAVADSLKYFTAGGRVVYGGGGISPDIFVPLDTTGNTEYLYKVRSQIPNFTYDYFADHPIDFRAFESIENFSKEFKLSGKVWQAFEAKLKDEKVMVKKGELNSAAKDIETRIKASFARLIWKNEGYYKTMAAIDNDIEAAMKDLNN